ncbi:unnamed protein product, partial [Closterium sp. NIES-53]
MRRERDEGEGKACINPFMRFVDHGRKFICNVYCEWGSGKREGRGGVGKVGQPPLIPLFPPILRSHQASPTRLPAKTCVISVRMAAGGMFPFPDKSNLPPRPSLPPGVSNETPREYVCNLGPDGRRRDADERPELMHGSVEFVAPKEYSIRDAMPPVYFFLLDVSFNAVASGAASAACSSISRILQDLP